jgi:hypothetical protein
MDTERVLAWVNGLRAAYNKPPISALPEDERNSNLSRSRSCPIARAIGIEGVGIAPGTAIAPGVLALPGIEKWIATPRYIDEAIIELDRQQPLALDME